MRQGPRTLTPRPRHPSAARRRQAIRCRAVRGCGNPRSPTHRTALPRPAEADADQRSDEPIAGRRRTNRRAVDRGRGRHLLHGLGSAAGAGRRRPAAGRGSAAGGRGGAHPPCLWPRYRYAPPSGAAAPATIRRPKRRSAGTGTAAHAGGGMSAVAAGIIGGVITLLGAGGLQFAGLLPSPAATVAVPAGDDAGDGRAASRDRRAEAGCRRREGGSGRRYDGAVAIGDRPRPPACRAWSARSTRSRPTSRH